MSAPRSLRKSITILLLSVVILEGGCRGLIEKPIVPDTGIAILPRGTLRITKSDGAVILLSDSFITNDSIVGLLSDAPHQRTAMVRTDVTKIEVRGDTTPRAVRIAWKIYLIDLKVVAVGGLAAMAIILWRYGP